MKRGTSYLWLLALAAVTYPLTGRASVIGPDPNPGYGLILYDGTVETLPTDQHWFYGESATGAGITSMVGTSALLDTSAANPGRAGWGYTDTFFNPLPLHAATGFTLTFDLQLLQQTSSSNDRAGLDLLVITSDPTKAIELAFWSDRIFTLNNDVPAFTHGQNSTPIDTTSSHHYVLSVSGNSFTLYDDTTPILTDLLRDYTASTATLPTPGGDIPVYQVPNSIFLGDDTTSAGGSFKLSRAEYLSQSVPEPASLSVLGLGALGLLRRRR